MSNQLPVTKFILAATYQLQDEVRRRVNRLVQETQQLRRKEVKEAEEERDERDESDKS